ncbi:MAG: dipicolinate synthase subunit B, partial [Clostridia bacterium]|nr:dipicolinate synthase subunit B [Clostridia bacterium]
SLSQNLRNIATLLVRKRVYLVPLKQDDPTSKPHSLVADFSRIPDALAAALDERQLRPLFE